MTKRKNVDDVTSNIPGSEGQSRKYGMSTLAVHAGARPDPVTGARGTQYIKQLHLFLMMRSMEQNYSTFKHLVMYIRE